MCIIIACPSGVDIPDDETLAGLWDMNPDGAGFMYSEGGRVEIRKGYMSLGALLSALSEFESRHDANGLDVCIHMRIATSGLVDKANCHPFPVDAPEKWRKRRVTCDCAVMHNGVFGLFDGTDDKSDTVQYVENILAPMYSIGGRPGGEFDKVVDSTRGRCRLAIMDGNGLHLYGKWHEDNGVYYSNDGYRYAVPGDLEDASWYESPCGTCALCDYCAYGVPMCEDDSWEYYGEFDEAGMELIEVID